MWPLLSRNRFAPAFRKKTPYFFCFPYNRLAKSTMSVLYYGNRLQHQPKTRCNGCTILPLQPAPLTGIETAVLCQLCLMQSLQPAPLTGIETRRCLPALTRQSALQPDPLMGIETATTPSTMEAGYLFAHGNVAKKQISHCQLDSGLFAFCISCDTVGIFTRCMPWHETVSML